MCKWFVAGLLASTAIVGHAYAADMELVTKAPAAPAAPVWTYTFDTSPQFVAWQSSRGWPETLGVSGHGSEFYDPFGLAANGTWGNDWRLNITARSGFVYANQSVGAFSGSIATTTDTTFSGTATYTGFNGYQPYLTIMTNLPTGQAALPNTATFARMDPDLVPLAVFGEGFNIGPTVGVNIPVNKELTVVPNVGYTWRGEWDKEGGFDPLTMTTVGMQATNPSQIWTGGVNATWVHGALMLQGSASYAVETINYVDQMPSYRSGPRTTVSGSGSYAWNTQWTTSFDGYFVHSERNDVLMPNVPTLVAEAFDSNSNVFRINAKQMYNTTVDGRPFSVGPVGSFMFRDHNSWDPTTAQFVPEKTRFTVGGMATYTYDKYNLSLRVEYEQINEDISPDKIMQIAGVATLLPGSGVPAVNGSGVLITAAVTRSFP